MTAEIAILNKAAVALAADSAVSIVTSGRETKIYNTNKLFMLSKYRPVGMMVYGSAELMGIPWETIIKSYRKDALKETTFKTLREYSDHFLTYLNNNRFLFPEKEQEDYVYGVTLGSCFEIKKMIDRKVEEATHKGVTVPASAIERINSQTIKEIFDFMSARPLLPTLPATFEKDILSKYIAIIDQAVDDVFKRQKLSAAARKQLRRISVGLFVRDTFGVRDPSGNELILSSGIVIAGFGDDELYPSVFSYQIEGVINDTLKYREGRGASINTNQPAALIAFAQQEMVLGFMTGVAPEYRDMLSEYLGKLFDKYPEEIAKNLSHLTSKQKAKLVAKLKAVGGNLASTFNSNLDDWAQAKNVNPILNTVSVLPIDELASMAESLVNLTSFKRRVTLVAETVGGPIDVAVISRGDGFIWIKRKHYFEAAENPHFLKNYFR
jgi:hypothetical protein